MTIPGDPHARGPLNSCGHRAARVTLPPRCCECGAYAHRMGEPYKVSPRLWWLLEWLTRRHVRKHAQPPKLEGRITYAGGD